MTSGFSKDVGLLKYSKLKGAYLWGQQMKQSIKRLFSNWICFYFGCFATLLNPRKFSFWHKWGYALLAIIISFSGKITELTCDNRIAIRVFPPAALPPVITCLWEIDLNNLFDFPFCAGIDDDPMVNLSWPPPKVAHCWWLGNLVGTWISGSWMAQLGYSSGHRDGMWILRGAGE